MRKRMSGTLRASLGPLGLALLALASPSATAHDLPGIVTEQTSLPPEVWTKIEEVRALQRFLAAEAAKSRGKDFELESVVDTSAVWSTRRVSVCFLDGAPTARLYVTQVAQRWTQGTGLQLDFGPSGSPRSCDAATPSNVRVSFAGLGARSYVGKEARQVPANLPTMNLGQLDLAVYTPDDDGVILHEFGHAIGFHHEHQSPAAVCESEFDWDFLYKKMATFGWSQAKVDHNMRQLEPSTRYSTTAFDLESVMLYALGRDTFRADLPKLTCYIPKRNTAISRTDREAAAAAYPAAVSSLRESLKRSLTPSKPAASAKSRDPAVAKAMKRLKELTDAR
jgi:hypothetical protein